MDGNGPTPAEMGLTTKDLGIKDAEPPRPAETSITGKELPVDWPGIASPDEEHNGYEALYDEGEDRNGPPSQQHIDRLSYSLRNGKK